jgi:hypothetical protein
MILEEVKMKRTLKLVIVGAAALTLLGTQVSFAADRLRTRDRSRTQDQTCLKDGSGTQTKSANQAGNLNQTRNRNLSGTATQKGK